MESLGTADAPIMVDDAEPSVPPIVAMDVSPSVSTVAAAATAAPAQSPTIVRRPAVVRISRPQPLPRQSSSRQSATETVATDAQRGCIAAHRTGYADFSAFVGILHRELHEIDKQTADALIGEFERADEGNTVESLCRKYSPKSAAMCLAVARIAGVTPYAVLAHVFSAPPIRTLDHGESDLLAAAPRSTPVVEFDQSLPSAVRRQLGELSAAVCELEAIVRALASPPDVLGKAIVPHDPGLVSVDVSHGLYPLPVPLLNTVNPDVKFEELGLTWITDIVYSPEVHVQVSSDMFLAGCTCARDGARCDSLTCQCVRESDGPSYRCGVIAPEKMDRPLIYECNKMCGCDSSCPNRVIQHGPRYLISIFLTPTKGWGVMAMERIPKGQFVCEYLGEIITDDEAAKRGKVQDLQRSSYLFDLDLDKESDDPCFVIDAKNHGNVSRFFNHSCDPNLSKYFFWVEHLDMRLPRVAFFTSRDVAKGEELTFDYQYERAKGRSHKKATIHCKCGASNCRKVLY